MVSAKTSSLRALSGDRNEQIRFYRWINHHGITKEQLINTLLETTSKLVKGRHVLALQDTTEINYEGHSERVSGLGTVGNGTDVGIFLHPLYVIDAHTHQGLGFGAIHMWNRFTAKDSQYQKLPIEEKESYRWIQTAAEGKQSLSEATCVTFIGDRENDIYEFLDRIPDEKTHILVRSRCDRVLSDQSKLYDKLAKSPVKKRSKLKLPATHKRKGSVIEVELRFVKVCIKKPKNSTDKSGRDSVELSVVQVKERGNQPGGIEWNLLTSHVVNTVIEAEQIVGWYKERWQIEQLFRTLKSQGIDIESSQLETEASLTKLVIVAVNAAMIIMQLVLAREGKTQHKTNMLFNEEEIMCLKTLLKKVEGRTEKQKNPYPPDNLAWASWIVGRLGGWKGYKSEGPVGPITMGRGLNKFYSIVEGFLLLKDTYTG